MLEFPAAPSHIESKQQLLREEDRAKIDPDDLHGKFVWLQTYYYGVYIEIIETIDQHPDESELEKIFEGLVLAYFKNPNCTRYKNSSTDTPQS